MILGDNIFHGATLSGTLNDAIKSDKAIIFGHRVADLQRFGVVSIDKEGSIINIAEKPKTFNANQSYAITGLYCFPTNVFDVTKTLKPSLRGETEITDVIKYYQEQHKVELQILKRGMCWFDTGTPDSMLDAAHYVKTIQTSQAQLVGSPHEVGFRNGWFSEQQLSSYLELDKSEYANKLRKLMEE